MRDFARHGDVSVCSCAQLQAAPAASPRARTTSLARLLGRFPSPTPLRGRARGQRHLQRVSESGGGSLGQRAVPARWFCRALARRGSPAAASERALHPAGTAQERQCVRGTHAFACTIDTAGPVPQRGLCFPRRGAPAARLCSPRLARFRRTGLPASAVPPLRLSGAAGGRAARGGKKPHRIALLPPVGSALHAPAASSADTSAVWPGLSQALGYAGGCGARRAPHARGAHQGDGAGSVARRCSHASSSARRAHPRTMTRRCRSEDADAVPKLPPGPC